jgi:hypothetical protein
MPLLRVSEKKLAANRANARLSKGPSTPEGNARSSQNACKHHLYARKYQIPPEWAARIHAVVAPCAATVENPIERARVVQYFFLKQWIRELDGYETRLLNQSIARHRNFNRGVHRFVTINPLFHAIELRIQDLSRQAERARRDWERTRETILLAELTPEGVETKPLTMTAAAAMSSPAPLVSPIHPTSFPPVTFQPDLHLRNWSPHHVH